MPTRSVLPTQCTFFFNKQAKYWKIQICRSYIEILSNDWKKKIGAKYSLSEKYHCYKCDIILTQPTFIPRFSTIVFRGSDIKIAAIPVLSTYRIHSGTSWYCSLNNIFRSCFPLEYLQEKILCNQTSVQITFQMQQLRGKHRALMRKGIQQVHG